MSKIYSEMNDPWDVKSVRLGHQYTSCMKINGVPLLPPVLSKECRKEMQYYKLLAKEVEKRISILQPYLESDTDSYEDQTDAPDITDCDEHQHDMPLEEKVEATIDFIVDKFSSRDNKNEQSNSQSPLTDKYNTNHSEVVIDLNVQIAGNRGIYSRSPRQSPIPDEIPERDCDYYKKKKKEKALLTDNETEKQRTQKELIDSIMDFELNLLSDKGDYLLQDGPSSLSSKSFTGSLHDIHTDLSKQSQGPKLIRQRSYTVLNPSPQLLAHLEVQSMNTGVELNSISMSESMSKLSSSAKKRKSWDLETAKVKWSSMALELKTKNIAPKSIASSNDKSKNVKTNSLKQDRRRQISPNVREPKSEPVEKLKHVQNSVKNTIAANGKGSARETPASTNTKLAKKSPKTASPKKEDTPRTVALISESDDPAARVRELYEKLQKQQLMQMANLMEKQKREQQLLQQVFEEQNNILLKQLKTVCPEASIKVKQAWGDLKDDNEMNRGPVSLSQLMNSSTPDHSIPNSPVAKTLTESNNCISKCDNMLKKSRDISISIRKQATNVRTANGVRNQKSADQVPMTSTQINSVRKSRSPPNRNTSRRLMYDTTASSDADTILTDRTNDTMADLNVTFPSDNSDSYQKSNARSGSKIYATRACSPLSPREGVEGAIKNLEDSIQTSMNSVGSRSVTKHSIRYRQPNAKELVAATKIVACAKGFLVRRLMRTERVQTTVQTIKDALLCALQLHQDREGIRGADVDLHRRLIQQITAACYTLHDTFVTSSSSERCAMIAADRARRQTLANKTPSSRSSMRGKHVVECESFVTCSVNYESESEKFERPRSRYMSAQRKVPWR